MERGRLALYAKSTSCTTLDVTNVSEVSDALTAAVPETTAIVAEGRRRRILVR